MLQFSVIPYNRVGLAMRIAHNIYEQELTAEAESKPFDEARNTVMATTP